MRAHVRRPDAPEHGGRTGQVRPSPQNALLQLQRQAGNGATSALVEGTAIPSVQRLHVQRNGTDPVVEKAKQEAAKQVAVPATPTTVPAPATAADATRMALILEADGPGHGLPATEIVEAQRGLPEVVEEYNASRSELVDMDEDERAAVFGVADTSGQEAEPDLSAVGKVLAVPSPNGEPGAQPLGPPSDSPDQIDAESEQTEPNMTRAGVALSASAQMLGVKPKVHDSDSKVAALLSRSDAKLAAAKHTVQQVVDAEGARTSTAPAVASRPRARRISGSASPPAPIPAQRWSAKKFFAKKSGKKRAAVEGVGDSSGILANTMAVGKLVEPAYQKTGDSPLEMPGLHQHDQHAQAAFAGMGHASNALGLLGGLTLLGQGIKDFGTAWKAGKDRGLDRRHRFTSKDSRHAWGKIFGGAAAMGKTILNFFKGPFDKARAAVGQVPVLGPIGAAIGAAASFVASGLAFRQSWRARRRRKDAREWEKGIDQKMGQWKGQRDIDDEAIREDGGIRKRLLAAVRALRIKATRKKRRRFGGGIIAATSGVGGIFAIMGLVGVANIWNPVGWAIGGAAAVAGLCLGVYKLIRFIKSRKRKAANRTNSKGGKSPAGKETKEAHAKFVCEEINCKSHKNSAFHADTMSRFVKLVLRKNPDKVKKEKPSYIAGKWSSW